MAGNGTDHGQSFSLGGKPPASSSVKNHFDGSSNPNQGEKQDKDLALAPNKFPREHGSDSLTEEQAQLS